MLYTGNPGAWTAQGSATYAALKGYPNLFLMLCGHITGEGRRADVYNGNTVYTLLADYQGRPSGGDGWLRVLEFVPGDNAIHASTYSPTLNRYETDPASQFTLSFDMGGVPFAELGAVGNVPSGGNAGALWTALQPGESYEWYVTVSDGQALTAGPVWSFTTPPAGGACCFASWSCQLLAPAVCQAAGGAYQGDFSVCDPNPCPPHAGDLNCDGTVNFDDINPFVLALSDPSAYHTTYPHCNILNGDFDGDGVVGFDDINPFVALLSGS